MTLGLKHSCLFQVILNGTAIERTERYGADIDYLKRHGLEYIKALKESKIDEFSRNYPKYLSLVAKYGAIEEDELKEKDTRYVGDPNTILVR